MVKVRKAEVKSLVTKKTNVDILNDTVNLNTVISDTDEAQQSEYQTMGILDDLRNFLFPLNKTQGAQMLEESGITGVSESDIDSLTKCGPNSENVKIVLKDGTEFLYEPQDDKMVLIAIFLPDGSNVVYDLFANNKIHNISIEDIENVRINSDGTITVRTKEGDKYSFIKNGDDYKIDHVFLADGTYINCDISDEEQQIIKDKMDGMLNDDAEILGVSYVKVDGESVPVYWVSGTGSNFLGYKNTITATKEALENYPSEVLEQMFSTGFKGVFVGPKSSQKYNGKNDAARGNWGAYAYLDDFIFVNIDSLNLGSDRRHRVILEHEFAHILDCSMHKLPSYYFSDNNTEFRELYNKYKKTLQELPDISYGSSCYPDGIPNIHEFFAEAIIEYLENPDDLRVLMPDLYEFVKEMFDEM